MSRIISIGTAVPPFCTKQSDILDFMETAYADNDAFRKLKVLFNYSGIDTRYSALPDFNETKSEHILFNGNPIAPNVDARLSVFKDQAVPLAIEAIQNSLNKIHTNVSDFGITHLITVTCTGIYAPGIGTEIIEQLDLPYDIFQTSVNFLGCNAAFHALKLGDMIAQTDQNAKVMIVCVELCTLHFQPKKNHDNLLSNTIFGDGAAAVIITSDQYSTQNKYTGLTMNGFYSQVLNKGKDLMAWNVTPLNFEMILDARIPDFIGESVDNLVLMAGRKLNISRVEIDKWAIHPGGKKILDTLKKQLQFNHDELFYAYKVLDNYGNMSSPTILFVLDEIINAGLHVNETIFSVGFGPGLSIETGLLTYAG